MTRPLDGIVVTEFGGFIAGPFAGQLLGDYGARVIKVEPPAGDPMRRWGVCDEAGQSYWWPGIARNKESIALDLTDDGDAAVARSIVDRSDIVIENFTPGRLAGFGLDYDTVSASNPGLIMVHVSGYGQDGPRSADRGFGSVGEAMGGLRALMGFPDRPPVRAGVSLGDEVAAMFAVIGALAALNERHRTGKGQEVDVALYESVFALTESLLPDFELGGVTRARTGSTLAGVAPSNVFTSRDGVEILIAANADPIYKRLTEAMARPDLAQDPRFSTHTARGEHAVELDAEIERWTRSISAEQLEAVLDEHGVPRGRIFTPNDMLNDEQYAAREMIARVEAEGYERPVPMPAVVPRFGGEVSPIRWGGRRLDADGEAIRREFGPDGFADPNTPTPVSSPAVSSPAGPNPAESGLHKPGE